MSADAWNIGRMQAELATTSLRWRYSRSRPNDPPVLEQLFRVTHYDKDGRPERVSEEWHQLPDFVED